MCGWLFLPVCCYVLNYVCPKECASLPVKCVTAVTLQGLQSMCGCFSSLSEMRVAITNKALTFLFTRDRRNLTLVFSVRRSWVVSDEKQAMM